MKNIILLLVIFILSGCAVEANININYDSTVDEAIKIAFSNFLAVNYDSPEEYAKSYLDYYNSAINYRDYEYIISENSNESYVSFRKKNENICDSIKYSLFSQYLYETIECQEDEYYVVIQSSGDQLISKPQNQKVFNVEDVVLNIKLPISAEENNADYVRDYTYTWNYDEETPINKNIYLKINKTALEQNKLRIEKEQSQNKTNNIFKIIIGIIVFVIVIIFAGFTLYKKYKNNQIEY